jgi:hypothetical protein
MIYCWWIVYLIVCYDDVMICIPLYVVVG